MFTNKEQYLFDALLPHAREKGVEIVTLEVVGARKAPTIRVYIDTEHGVSFDELASAQKWINDIMDERDPFPGAYTLEVSSPGIDRPLRTAEHFERFVGYTAVIKTATPFEGRSAFTGVIVRVKDQKVQLEVEDQPGQPHCIPLDAIKRAHLKGRLNFNGSGS